MPPLPLTTDKKIVQLSSQPPVDNKESFSSISTTPLVALSLPAVSKEGKGAIHNSSLYDDTLNQKNRCLFASQSMNQGT